MRIKLGKVVLSLIIGLLLMFYTSEAKCQIRSVEWDGGFILTTENHYYAGVLDALAQLSANLPFGLQVESRYRVSAFRRIWLDESEAKLRTCTKCWGYEFIGLAHWKLKNYAVGYHIGFIPRHGFPLGLELECLYDQEGYKVKIPRDGSKEDKQWMVKRQWSPTALVRLRLGSWLQNNDVTELMFGARYNNAFYYKDKWINDKNAVNSGLSYIFGINGFSLIGQIFDGHFSEGARVEIMNYDFYNKDFVYNGDKIYQNSKSKLIRIEYCLRVSF